jgi:hypothetical protein
MTQQASDDVVNAAADSTEHAFDMFAASIRLVSAHF